MASGQMDDQLLPISLALPIFSADAISSVAYATEAAMVVLVGVSLGALRWTLPIAIAVSILMAIVVASYRSFERIVAPASGFSAKELAWLLTNAPAETIVLRPAPSLAA